MRKYKLWLGLAAVLCFATAGIAVASEEPNAQTQAVAGKFEASMKRIKSRMCRGSDGAYKVTHAVYWGTATSDNPLLNGRLKVRLDSFINVEKQLGKVNGELHIASEETGKRAHGRVLGVYDKGEIEGMVIGLAGRPRAKLLLNFSGKLDDSTVSGVFGADSSDNQSLLFARGCKFREPEESASEERKTERTEEHPERTDKPKERPNK